MSEAADITGGREGGRGREGGEGRERGGEGKEGVRERQIFSTYNSSVCLKVYKTHYPVIHWGNFVHIKHFERFEVGKLCILPPPPFPRETQV